MSAFLVRANLGGHLIEGFAQKGGLAADVFEAIFKPTSADSFCGYEAAHRFLGKDERADQRTKAVGKSKDFVGINESVALQGTQGGDVALGLEVGSGL